MVRMDRDNAWAGIFATTAVFEPSLSSTAITQKILQGELGVVIRVSSYNGNANDDNVVVALYPSPGLDHDPCLPPDSVPAWDGDDQWPVLASSLLGSGGGAVGGGAPADCSSGAHRPPGYDLDSPRFVDTGAYVTDWVVVANLPDVEIILTGDDTGSAVKLTAGFLTGRLEQDASSLAWTLRDGLLVGRWAVTDVFRSLSAMVSGSGEQVCTDHVVYPLIKSAVCKYPDIASVLGGPTTPCDAIGFGMGFAAEEARVGSFYVPANLIPPCPPETDPLNDTCDDTI